MEYVYILECGDGSLYTGWTNDIEKRFEAHSAGKGAKYTRGRGPFRLVHLEIFDDRLEAKHRETAVKKLSHAQKLLLAADAGEGEAAALVRKINGAAAAR